MHLSQCAISECNLWQRILGFVNGYTLTQLVALLQQCGIRDHQDVPAESQKDGSHLVPRPHTAQQMTALLQQFVWERLDHPLFIPDLTPSAFTSFFPSEEASWCRFQNVADVQEAASQWFHLQILEFCAEGIKLLITHCDRCMNL